MSEPNPHPRPPSPASPSLSRDAGRITFPLAFPSAAAAYAVSLCKFLAARGFPSSVVDERAGTTAVQLRGVPDLDAVERHAAAWEAAAGDRPPEPPTR